MKKISVDDLMNTAITFKELCEYRDRFSAKAKKEIKHLKREAQRLGSKRSRERLERARHYQWGMNYAIHVITGELERKARE